MDFLSYIVVLLISFIGLYLGSVLSALAYEEMPSEEKFVRYASIVAFMLALFLGIYRSSIFLAIAVAVVIGIIMLIFMHDDTWAYSSLGVLFYFSSTNGSMFYVASIVFILGMFLSSLRSRKYFKKRMPGFRSIAGLCANMSIRYFWYVVLGVVSYIVFLYV